MYKIAVFGGAFDPFHSGHMDSIRQAMEQAEKVWIMPSSRHPYGKQMAPFVKRCEWVMKSLLEWASPKEQCRIVFSTLDSRLAQQSPRPIYSIDTLEAISRSQGLGAKDLALVVGEDVAPYLDRFERFRDLSRFGLIPTQEDPASLHSSDIRHDLESGAYDIGRMGTYLPRSTQTCIINHYGKSTHD